MFQIEFDVLPEGAKGPAMEIVQLDQNPQLAVLRDGASADAVCAWANQRLGKMQRIASVRIVTALPRNEAGKVLKRALRDAIAEEGGS